MTQSPFANHTHIYIIAVGILIGIILGPGVLGRIAPDTYQQMFASSQAKQIADIIALSKKNFEKEITSINGKKMTLAEVKSKLNIHNQEIVTLNKLLLQEQNKGAVNLVIALLLGLVVIMILETFMGPGLNLDSDNSPNQTEKKYIPSSLGRLVTVRYALIAGCLAVLLARPKMLGESTLILALIVTVIVLIVGLTPLGSKRKILLNMYNNAPINENNPR